ncbi:MAG TPA: hypothetical protein VFB07_10715 [Vicinamibacterales bacterium]|nr:hypothetical protein [Vicinamibacterales bacterium]
MIHTKNAASCRWAVQTLLLETPLWLDAWTCPWSCVRDTDARPVTTTDECRACPRWQPRQPTPRRDRRDA